MDALSCFPDRLGTVEDVGEMMFNGGRNAHGRLESRHFRAIGLCAPNKNSVIHPYRRKLRKLKLRMNKKAAIAGGF